jgi:hypothetical protein
MQSSGSAESSSTRYAWWLGHNIVQSACMVCMIARSQSAISVLERMHWCLVLVRGAAQCSTVQHPGHLWGRLRGGRARALTITEWLLELICTTALVTGCVRWNPLI